RDHHEYFRKNILTDDIKPEDENAKEALEDPEYFKLLKEFDEKLWSLTDPLWEERLR
ncbi:MAG: radical SAM protein, partial [Caldiserica bacterium]